MKKKMGRPMLPSGEAKAFQIGIRFNNQEAKTVRNQIAKSGLPTADWARQALLSSANQASGFVKGLKWTAGQLNGKTVFKCMACPPQIMVPAKFSAKAYRDGIILYIVFSSRTEEHFMPVKQNEAEALFLNQNGEFEIPWV